MTLPSARYADNAARYRAFVEIERRLREQPGVQAVGATSTLALRGFTWTGDTTIEGRDATDYERDTRHMSMTPGYFGAMGIRLLAGRLFDDGDTREKPPVTIVNESLARRYFRGLPNAAVVGKRVTFGRPQDNSPWVTIVGVVADEKQDGLDRPAEPTEYSSIGQRHAEPADVRRPHDGRAGRGVRAARERRSPAVDKDLALTQTATLEDVVDGVDGRRAVPDDAAVGVRRASRCCSRRSASTACWRTSCRSARASSASASRSARRPAALFRMVVGQGMRPVAVGAALGLAGAVAVTTLMQSLLFGVDAGRSGGVRASRRRCSAAIAARRVRGAGAARDARGPARGAAGRVAGATGARAGSGPIRDRGTFANTP